MPAVSIPGPRPPSRTQTDTAKQGTDGSSTIPKKDVKGKSRATDSSSSDSDTTDSGEVDSTTSSGRHSAPQWQTGHVTATGTPSPSRSNETDASKAIMDFLAATLPQDEDRSVGQKYKRATTDTGEWLPGEPLPDTWPERAIKRTPAQSPRAPMRGTFPVGSPPTREEMARRLASAKLGDWTSRHLSNASDTDWDMTSESSVTAPSLDFMVPGSVPYPTSSNLTPSVLSAEELCYEEGGTSSDVLQMQYGCLSATSAASDPLMDALADEIAQILSLDGADSTAHPSSQPIPIHFNDTRIDDNAITALENEFGAWDMSTSPRYINVYEDPSLFSTSMYSTIEDVPRDGESMEDYLSRTLQPDYSQSDYSQSFASPWSVKDTSPLPTDTVWDFADLSASLPTVPTTPTAYQSEAPVTRLPVAAPSTSAFTFSMPFQVSEAQGAVGAAELIAEMQRTGALPSEPLDGLTAEARELMFDDAVFSTDDLETTWDPAAFASSGDALVDKSTSEPFLIDHMLGLMESYPPTTGTVASASSSLELANAFDVYPSNNTLDSFDSSLFGLNTQAFDWGDGSDGLDPVDRTSSDVERHAG